MKTAKGRPVGRYVITSLIPITLYELMKTYCDEKKTTISALIRKLVEIELKGYQPKVNTNDDNEMKLITSSIEKFLNK
jgi:hypothetical protein